MRLLVRKKYGHKIGLGLNSGIIIGSIVFWLALEWELREDTIGVQKSFNLEPIEYFCVRIFS